MLMMTKFAVVSFLLLCASRVSSAEARKNCIPDWATLQATVSGAALIPGLVHTLCPETVFRESGQIRFRVNATVECGPSGTGRGCVIEPAVHHDRNRRSSFFLVASRAHQVQPHVIFVGLTMQKYYGKVGSSAVTVAGYDANPDQLTNQFDGGATFINCVFRDNASPYSSAVRGKCAPNLKFFDCTFTGERYLGIYLGIYIGASSSSACGLHGSLIIQDSVFEDNSGSVYFYGLETLSVVNSCFLGNEQHVPYSWFEDIAVGGRWPAASYFENNFSDGADSTAGGKLFFQHSVCGPRAPSSAPSTMPSESLAPSSCPTQAPSSQPSSSQAPSFCPSIVPSSFPSSWPSSTPTISIAPSAIPSLTPSVNPSSTPSSEPSEVPSQRPSDSPSLSPSKTPSQRPSTSPVPSFSTNFRPGSSTALGGTSHGYRVKLGLLSSCFFAASPLWLWFY